MIADPESPSGRAMSEIAGKVAQQVSIRAFRHLTLSIVEE